jgi:hypothetical protein
MPEGVKLFNTHGPYRRDLLGTLRDPCAHRRRRQDLVHRALYSKLKPDDELEARVKN